jgi:hypothetical protein
VETGVIAMDDEFLVALRQHWPDSDANEFDAEHRIYRDDAPLRHRSI